MTASTWLAVAAWAIVAVAAIAVAALLWQLREAQRLRREQAQPYVVAFTETPTGSPQLTDLVVRNFGSTAAYDVRLSANPALQRTSVEGAPDGVEDVWTPEIIRTLAPGQEWRTYWDFIVDRLAGALPSRHSATVTYRDSRGVRHRTSAVLDWSEYTGRRWVEQYGIHDTTLALREINRTLRGVGPQFGPSPS